MSDYGWVEDYDERIDYQAKYNDLKVKHRQLRNTIKDSLVALYPWYSHGKVGNPMDAVNALKAIDRAVNS